MSKDVPYGDCFFTIITLVVEPAIENSIEQCKVKVYLKFKFLKTVFIRMVIENQASKSIREYWALWHSMAKSRIEQSSTFTNRDNAQQAQQQAQQQSVRSSRNLDDASNATAGNGGGVRSNGDGNAEQPRKRNPRTRTDPNRTLRAKGFIEKLPDPIKNAPVYEGLAKAAVAGFVLLTSFYFLLVVNSLRSEIDILQGDHANLENRLFFLQSFADEAIRRLADDDPDLAVRWEKWKVSSIGSQSYSNLQAQIKELQDTLVQSESLLAVLQEKALIAHAQLNSGYSWMFWIFAGLMVVTLIGTILFWLPFVIARYVE
jgi:hypothetical protein